MRVSACGRAVRFETQPPDSQLVCFSHDVPAVLLPKYSTRTPFAHMHCGQWRGGEARCETSQPDGCRAKKEYRVEVCGFVVRVWSLGCTGTRASRISKQQVFQISPEQQIQCLRATSTVGHRLTAFWDCQCQRCFEVFNFGVLIAPFPKSKNLKWVQLTGHSEFRVSSSRCSNEGL